MGRVKTIVAAAFFGVCGGITGTAIFLAWIWPRYGAENFLTTKSWLVTQNKSSLSDSTAREWDRQVVTLYAKTTETNGVQFFNQADRLGEAAVLTAEGWLVMYYSHPVRGVAAWRALLSNGRSYTVDQALADVRSGFLYLKIHLPDAASGSREEFLKPVTFVTDVNSLDGGAYLHAGLKWQPTGVVGKTNEGSGSPHLDSAPVTAVNLDRALAAGTIIFTGEGEFLGMVAHDAVVMPALTVNQVWPLVLKNQKAVYPTLGVEGLFNEEQAIVVAGERQTGFVVTRVLLPGSHLRRGDIITKINDEPMDADHVWDVLSHVAAQLTVVRSGKTIQLTVPIVQL